MRVWSTYRDECSPILTLTFNKLLFHVGRGEPQSSGWTDTSKRQAAPNRLRLSREITSWQYVEEFNRITCPNHEEMRWLKSLCAYSKYLKELGRKVLDP